MNYLKMVYTKLYANMNYLMMVKTKKNKSAYKHEFSDDG